MAGKFGKKYALLRRGKTTAHHKDLLVSEKLPVAGGTICHTTPLVLLLTFESDHSGMGTGGQQDTKALVVSSVSVDGLYISG